MATYNLTQTTPSKLQTGDIINVPYSGTYKTITLPKGIYKLEVWGAQGGSFNTTYVGGKGGYSYGILNLKDASTTLYCYAGGKGTNGTTSGTFAGGWNGGGKAYASSATYDMSAGGGGSDIRIGSTSLYARVIVAGGGGGAGSYSSSYRYSGGAGGGTSGVAGSRYSKSYYAGNGGSQTAAGTSYYGTTTNSTSYGTPSGFGTGGAAGSSTYVAGGGGGWYGGGYARRASGGGGSGYVYTSSTASNYPSGCLLTSIYYLTNASTTSGATSFIDPDTGSSVTGRSGNGYVRITVIEIKKDLKVKTKVEYTELSYIESTGTQYVDTGFMPNQDTRVVMSLRDLPVSTNAEFAFGSRTTTSASDRFTFVVDSTKLYRSDYGAQNISFGSTVNYTGKFTIDKNKNVTTLNNENSVTHNSSTFTGTYPLFLFACNTGGSSTLLGSFKLEGCQIYNNGTIVRDYIPVLDNNNVVCLFDKVNSEFVYNAGTGSFTAGEIIQKVTTSVWKDGQECYVKANDNTWKVAQSVYVKATEDLTVLDYIESTGTQYIDTGISATNGFITELGMARTGTSAELYIVGAHNLSSPYERNCIVSISNTQWELDIGDAYPNSNHEIAIDTKVIVNASTVKGNSYLDIDGVRIITSNDTSTRSSSNIWIFTNQYDAKDGVYGIGRLYYLKIYNDGGTLIRDYIPVLDSSSVTCLYDKVTKQLFYNTGTGEFIAGYKTEFDANIDLQFLASTGTQYIDTGFVPNQDTKVEFEAVPMSISNAATADFGFVPFGAAESYSSKAFEMYTWENNFQFNYGATSLHVQSAKLNVKTKFVYDKGDIRINFSDGSSTSGNIATSTFTAPYNMIIFGSQRASIMLGCNRIYWFKVYDNGVLIRDYIPKTDAQGTPAMYDKLSGTYYYNAGTGTFNAGTVLKRSYWKQVI